jgi:lipopolysaccharide export system protein LptA
MVAQGNVAVIGKDQRFSGDRFAWTPKDSVGILTGRPAKMTAPGSKAHADTIQFNQTTQSVNYVGNAVVEIELKPE